MATVKRRNPKKKPGSGWSDIALYLIILVVIGGLLLYFYKGGTKPEDFTYNEFIQQLEEGNVKNVNITPGTGENNDIRFINGLLKDDKEYTTSVMGQEQIDELYALSNTYRTDDIEGNEFVVNRPTEARSMSGFWMILSWLIPLAIVGVIMYMFMKQAGGNNKAFDFAKSRAKLNKSKDVTFDDVKGQKEEKEELVEIIDFLKNPKKYNEMGARIPKGVLLVGPPGTGKTLLARACAGEASVPFYSISGSDFVEMFVGVGASRVRNMFENAKKNAPCIIFIDEIDAVGRQRGAGLGGGHDEREQTLNELLTQMDGFGANSGVIVMAATNRPDVLDPALLRPGRFDRQITIPNPDVRGREEILELHARNKKLQPTVRLSEIAKRTPGFSGAQLENLLNEAALLAAREDRKLIEMQDIDEAIDRVMMGPAKKSRVISKKEKNVIAHHEAGHAVIGLKLENAEIVHKVTIIPRGQAGGYALMLPEEDRFLSTKQDLVDRITGLLGGRVSEEIIFGEITTGAHNDFEKATKIARAMVTEYGMSNLGPVQYEHQGGDVFLGRDYVKDKNFSDTLAHEIDQEVRTIIDQCYERAKEVLNKHLDLVKLIASTLVEVETLTKEDIDELVDNGKISWWEEKKAREKEEEAKVKEEVNELRKDDLPEDYYDKKREEEDKE
ncbi:ATP-dependent zinc metalloprotease FtsH [Haloplasma contractile]|uniref:ATP-dependent zinc metalloprotease FtsH n=1 Tax=Haloplasma contractile SSD-17B TaxID=1033810 RepID=U2FHY5_9MOLU|nr:ATP-dependent zinc metalloprotease FtsH [Haloplasma contractile]ERJ12430.1 ATP-dependent zinc metalloprotease FtsH protein [Haloplasma contractile SSD-17B]